jgi:hypothetical protein
MKLRVVLFLAAAFLGAALALHALSGCSDDDGEGPVDPNCEVICGHDCFRLSGGECRCLDPTVCEEPAA